MEDARGVGVFTFSEILNDQTVFVYVLRLKQSFLLWIGSEQSMNSLAVAMMNAHVRGSKGLM